MLAFMSRLLYKFIWRKPKIKISLAWPVGNLFGRGRVKNEQIDSYRIWQYGEYLQDHCNRQP